MAQQKNILGRLFDHPKKLLLHAHVDGKRRTIFQKKAV